MDSFDTYLREQTAALTVIVIVVFTIVLNMALATGLDPFASNVIAFFQHLWLLYLVLGLGVGYVISPQEDAHEGR